MCVPQPDCTFWGRDTLLALAGDQTVVVRLPADHPVNIPATCLYQVPKLKLHGHTNLESPLCHGASLSAWTSLPLPLLE
jgi:hypothetical protein